MGTEPTPPYFERVLGLTAFAAGSVDIISFVKLGGIFASAMTGNVAFLGFYLGRLSFVSALGSGIALLGFVIGGVIGTLVGRGRERDATLAVLIGLETILLACAVMLWLPTHHRNGSPACDGLIGLLSVSMGLQSVIGKRINLSNIPTVVFTSTLTNIVIALTDMVSAGSFRIPPDTKRQIKSFLSYFAGALSAGFTVYFQAGVLIYIPVAALALAYVAQTKPAGIEPGRSEN